MNFALVHLGANPRPIRTGAVGAARLPGVVEMRATRANFPCGPARVARSYISTAQKGGDVECIANMAGSGPSAQIPVVESRSTPAIRSRAPKATVASRGGNLLRLQPQPVTNRAALPCESGLHFPTGNREGGLGSIAGRCRGNGIASGPPRNSTLCRSRSARPGGESIL